MRRLMHLVQSIGTGIVLGALGLMIIAGPAHAESGRIVVLNGQELKP